MDASVAATIGFTALAIVGILVLIATANKKG